jgi:uncharacterized coiled-coil protein SlyX
MAQSLEERTATLREAIAVQESLRTTLGDAVVDATIAALKEQLAVSEVPGTSSARHLRETNDVVTGS